MSGTAGVMDCLPRPRQKAVLLIVLLLKSANIIWLHGTPVTGADYNVHCVNDYLFTVNCSLRIAPSENTSNSNSSYWLSFTETVEETQYKCMLTRTKEDYFCTFKTSDGISEHNHVDIFGDLDGYKISLCHDGNEECETCEVLHEEYQPVNHIKPVAPCCLSVSHNSSQHHFTWKSIYENYSTVTDLPNNLQYQVRYYKREEHEVKLHDIYTESTSYSVDDQNFVPDTEYGARVRCTPTQASYKGEWSDWSIEAHWRTKPAMNGFSTHMSKKVLIPICGLVAIVLLVCYAPIKKWKQNVFIPTPAPYFHTLYSDCQGDFKSWVVTHENTADMLEKEETLQIDILTKCADVQEDDCPPKFDPHVMEGSSYSNITAPVYDTALLGIPYAVSTMIPLSAQGGSTNSLILGSKLGSPAGDSGCWLCSDTSLERDPPWYCNEYCTLSSFQQSGSIPAEDHVSF
ncbi:interleukin-21 receptor [Archocentrus centrarchus]|uniref:interleukin-21 receptor n=1 Tax=Archocentrus centrarchus TaxID=63155 RepID=UPI0011EA23CC|nr:interleukin-21 receptor-like [Archocentrus centrarchus]